MKNGRKMGKIMAIDLRPKPEAPNARTAELLALSKKQIDNGDYYKFEDNNQSLEFLAGYLRINF